MKRKQLFHKPILFLPHTWRIRYGEETEETQERKTGAAKCERSIVPVFVREEQAKRSFYGRGRIVLPTPQCIVFYNGTQAQPEEQVLRLSDSFETKAARADVELTVRMLNINYGHNSELMERCRVLWEYSRFVQISREYMAEAKNWKEALAEAIDYCIEQDILSEFLRINRMEVLGMFLEEFDAEKYERTIRSEGREEGLQYTIEILRELDHSRDIVKKQLKEKYSMPEEEAEEKLLRYWK